MLLLFTTEHYFIVHLCHIFVVPLSTDGHLGQLCITAIMKRALCP